MRDGGFSEIIAIIVAFVLVVIVPNYNLSWATNNKLGDYVYNQTDDFQKAVRKKGYIEKKDYENYLINLSKTHKSFEVEMIHTKITYYPLTPTSPGYTADKPYSEEDFKYDNSKILGTLYSKTNPGDYVMNVGDNFKITVLEKDSPDVMPGGEKIWAVSGGAIGNEDN